jgi:hypothetical protein
VKITSEHDLGTLIGNHELEMVIGSQRNLEVTIMTEHDLGTMIGNHELEMVIGSQHNLEVMITSEHDLGTMIGNPNNLGTIIENRGLKMMTANLIVIHVTTIIESVRLKENEIEIGILIVEVGVVVQKLDQDIKDLSFEKKILEWLISVGYNINIPFDVLVFRFIISGLSHMRIMNSEILQISLHLIHKLTLNT